MTAESVDNGLDEVREYLSRGLGELGVLSVQLNDPFDPYEDVVATGAVALCDMDPEAIRARISHDRVSKQQGLEAEGFSDNEIVAVGGLFAIIHRLGFENMPYIPGGNPTSYIVSGKAYLFAREPGTDISPSVGSLEHVLVNPFGTGMPLLSARGFRAMDLRAMSEVRMLKERVNLQLTRPLCHPKE